ncbi:LysR family transcriptional regulator [bacterium]|nr:LysR family transcriptional regulator [bacterium]
MNTKDLALFIHTADSGSITRAAEQLEMTTAAASAGLKRLEQQLEAQLFIRSTRQLRITAEGERFLVYSRKALTNLDAGKASIQALEGKVAGELRISAPSDLGRNLLLGFIDDIMELHPDLSISLLLGDSIADFYQDRVDLAIRYGNQSDSSMVAFKLATIDRVLCASPSYLATFGMPATPYDLLQHNCLFFQLNGRTNNQWEFIPVNNKKYGNEKIKITVDSNRCSNDGDAVRLWAIAGKGIAYKSRLDMTEDLRAGRVVRVLPEYHSPSIDLNLMSPTREQITPAVLLLRDILREKFTQLLDV